MSHVDFPLHFDGQGRTAQANDDAYLRDLIEIVLFTAPGERVNRPDFGCGVMQLVFAPNSVELAAASQLLVQGALQQWLGEYIVVGAVEVQAQDATLQISVQYVDRRTQLRHTAQFTRAAAGP